MARGSCRAGRHNPGDDLKSTCGIKCASYGVGWPRGSHIEKRATSCPWARSSSMTSNRYISVPLKGKLYLLQNKTRIGPVPPRRGSSLKKQICKTLQIPGPVEVLVNVGGRATPHVFQ